MIAAITSISEIKSREHGGSVFRLDGYYVDEFHKLEKLYTFVDHKNDNFADWESVLRTIAENRGNVVELRGCRFKNRAKGLLSADCRPQVEAIYPQPEKRPPKTNPGNEFNRLFGKL
jgi:hypothetical protein